MKRIFLKTAAVILILSGAAGIDHALADGSKKIGLVNMQLALNTSISGKRAMEKLKKELDVKLKTIKEKENEIKVLEDSINLQGMLLKESERKEIEEKYYRKLKQLERLREDSNAEMAGKEREMTRSILSDVISIARKIGQEDGYTLIMEKGPNIIFSIDEIDITDKVIKRYNEEKKLD